MRPDDYASRHDRRSAVSRDGSHATRNGVTLIEVVVSLVLLGVVFAGSIPAIVWVVRSQRALERRQAAILEASNLLDRLTGRAWSELPIGDLPDITLPPEIADDFPALRVAAHVVEATEPLSRRVMVEIAWEDAPGRPNRPVSLSGWVFPGPGAAQ